MSNYKKASQLGLRFQTNRGPLSVEQLWSLNLTDLSNSIKSVKKVLKKTDGDEELAFLEDSVVEVDIENQLRFDILKDVYLTIKSEKEALRDAAKVKEHNQKILAEIERRKEAKITTVSDDELEGMLIK